MAERKTIKDDALKLLLVKHFEKGETAPTNLYELLRTKYKLGKQRFLHLCNATLQDWVKIKKQAQDEAIQSAEKEAINEAVMSRTERQQVLTQIARGQIPLKKAMVVDGQIEYIEVIADWMDRKSAIAELNKMDGEYAPEKRELTGKDGKPLLPSTPIDYSNLSEEELETLQKLHAKAAGN